MHIKSRDNIKEMTYYIIYLTLFYNLAVLIAIILYISSELN